MMIPFMFWNIMLCSGHIIIHIKKIIWLWYPTKKNYLALILSKKNYLAFIWTQKNYLTPNKIQSPPPPLDIKWAAPYEAGIRSIAMCTNILWLKCKIYTNTWINNTLLTIIRVCCWNNYTYFLLVENPVV